MSHIEQPLIFHCGDSRLLGIATLPENPAKTGVLIVVGGPQYRSGSHRQFTLLARHLAASGYASLRFDYRGMGDSEGAMRNFEAVDEDIRVAIDTLLKHAPTLQRVIIWGLCDAASAALFYAHTDPRVSGLILLNPWVHTEAGEARARLKHYYLARLMQRSFWIKILSGKVAFNNSLNDLSKSAQCVMTGNTRISNTPADPRHGSPGFLDRMLEGLCKFQGPVLNITSGKDSVAQEFNALIKNNIRWKKLCSDPKFRFETIKQANHTFSSQLWRAEVAELTTLWLCAMQNTTDN